MNIIKVELNETIALESKAKAEQSRLILAAQEITAVDSPEVQSLAALRGKSIKTWLAEVEKTRKEVKAPVLQLGKRIDELAEEYTAPLLAETARLAKLITDFQAAERKRSEEAERRRQEELQKAEAERRAAEQAAREAQAKLDSDADAFFTTDAPEQLAAAMDRQVAATQQIVTVAARPAIEAPRASGLVSRKVVEFEITDALALYRERPEFFELVPRRNAIRAVITKDTSLPGLRVWEETKTGFRA